MFEPFCQQYSAWSIWRSETHRKINFPFSRCENRSSIFVFRFDCFPQSFQDNFIMSELFCRQIQPRKMSNKFYNCDHLSSRTGKIQNRFCKTLLTSATAVCCSNSGCSIQWRRISKQGVLKTEGGDEGLEIAAGMLSSLSTPPPSTKSWARE